MKHHLYLLFRGRPATGIADTRVAVRMAEPRLAWPASTPPPVRPVLSEQPSRFILLEREIERPYRPQMLEALQLQHGPRTRSPNRLSTRRYRVAGVGAGIGASAPLPGREHYGAFYTSGRRLGHEDQSAAAATMALAATTGSA